MFKRLRIRFIAIAAVAVFIILTSIVGVINSTRYVQSTQEIDKILQLLIDNDGSLPSASEASEKLGSQITTDGISRFRYYSVVVDSNGDIVSSNTSNISLVDDAQAVNYAEDLLDSDETEGTFTGDNDTIYSYRISQNSDKQKMIVVLDSTEYYDNTNNLLILSLQMAIVSFVFFVVVITLVSGIVIRPFVTNYEKQRRFITNAGHELKTPLAIISANTELQEMMTGETEWTKSTQDQVARLTTLINSLVALSRLEEQPDVVLHDVDFSDVAEDAAEDFKGPIIRDGKTFDMQIAPDIHVKAEEKTLFELVTLLVDNANKYCDPQGQVLVKLSQTGRTRKRAKLEISNTYKEGKDIDYSKFFERFYRKDESHNSKKRSGYGIGLSMAQSMVRLFHGRINASYKDETITFTVII